MTGPSSFEPFPSFLFFVAQFVFHDHTGPVIFRFIPFLLVMTLALAAIHYYIWLRLFHDPGWAVRPGAVILGALCIALPLAFFVRRLSHSLGGYVAKALFTWLGVAFVLVATLAAADLVRLFARGVLWLATLWQRERPLESPERRLFMARTLAGVVVTTAATATAWGVRAANGEVDVREVPVRLARHPKALDGFSIVQLSDIHIDRTVSDKFLKGIVEQTNRLRPDAVVITGDVVDDKVPALAEKMAVLGDIKARFGTYFIPGNHEHYVGFGPWLDHLPKLGLRVLMNERVSLGARNGASFDLAGIDDFMGDPNLERALAGRDSERELVLLAHQPRAIKLAAKAGVDLQLSGHTHGGQIWPFGLLVMLQQPYLAGLYRHNPATQIYVSRGTGYWGPPIRLGAPAEITKIVLSG